MPIPFPEQPEPPRRPVEFDAPDAGMPDHALGRSSVAPLIDPHWAELSRLVGRAETNRAEMARLQAERAELCAEALDLVAMRVAQRQAARPNREIGDTIPLREVIAGRPTFVGLDNFREVFGAGGASGSAPRPHISITTVR
mgnify:CR=1 FL=1